MTKNNPDEILSSLASQKIVIQQKINEYQRSLLKISQLQANIVKLKQNLNQPEFVISPAMVFDELKNYGTTKSLEDTNETLQLLHPSSDFMAGFILHLDKKRATDCKWGIVTLAAEKDTFVSYLIPTYSLHCIFDAGPENELQPRFNDLLEQYQNQYRLEIVGDPFGRVLLRCHDHDIRQRFMEVWIPVSDICYNQYCDDQK